MTEEEQGPTLAVEYHAASDRYYLVSKERDDNGVPLVEIQINRALFGDDERRRFATWMWRKLKGVTAEKIAASDRTAKECER